MNGSENNYQPSTGLPAPENHTNSPEISREIADAGQNNPVMPTNIPTGPLPTRNIPASPITPQLAQGASNTISIPVNDAPVSADDSDLIEKEWVNKAKYIVEATSKDPHLLNKEMNKFKADYIQKRYKKQLKVDED